MKSVFVKRVITTVLTMVMCVSSVLPNGVTAIAAAGGQPDRETLIYGSDRTEYYLGTASHFALFGTSVGIYADGTGQYKDCEGRIAADEFYVNSWQEGTWGYPVSGFLACETDRNKGKLQGAASIICNNAESKEFGFIKPDYNEQITGKKVFVVSDKAESFVEVPDNFHGREEYYRMLNERVVKVEENSVINFEEEMDLLREKSRRLANTEQNGVVEIREGKLVLSEKKPEPGAGGPGAGGPGAPGTKKVFYFNLTEEQWTASSGGIRIDLPRDAFVVISVPGKTINITGGQSDMLYWGRNQVMQSEEINGQLLFNFFQAESVNLYVGARGCILAPVADIKDSSNNAHHAAQIIGRTISICAQMGRYGFKLPASAVTEDPSKNYTVHYMYYDTDGSLKEVPSAVYELFIGKACSPMPGEHATGYETGDEIRAFDESDESREQLKQAFYSSNMSYYAEHLRKGGNIRFEVYEDGKLWFGSIFGRDLLDHGNYLKMTKLEDINWHDSYKFENSNVFFIMYPAAKVNLDVSWDDRFNQEGLRPNDVLFESKVSLMERGSLEENVWYESKRGSLDHGYKKHSVDEKWDDITDSEVEYECYTYQFDVEVPILGRQMLFDEETGAAYGVSSELFGPDGLFYVSYQVPDGYVDATEKSVDAYGYVDEEGYVAEYHIVLRRRYNAAFYLVLPDGSRTEIFKEGFYDEESDDYVAYFGSAGINGLPELNEDEIELCMGEHVTDSKYTISWRDVETGKVYKTGDGYMFDYKDAEFETVLRLTDLVNGKTPWLYCHIISYLDNFMIPGSSVYSRLTADKNADEYIFIQKKDNSGAKASEDLYAYDDELKEGKFKDDNFMIVSMAYGVDLDRAEYSRITISNVGFGSNDAIFYETQKNQEIADSFCDMPGRKKSQSMSTAELLPHDPYVNEYDGVSLLRFVIPEEYVDDDLYMTVYYTDAAGRESVWFYYSFNIRENKFWTIQGQ